ncbi:hypothetical protein P7K49_038299, partial [Saguinus oedipus]
SGAETGAGATKVQPRPGPRGSRRWRDPGRRAGAAGNRIPSVKRGRCRLLRPGGREA